MSAKLLCVVFLLNVLGATIATNVHSRHVRSTSTSNGTKSSSDLIAAVITEIESFVSLANETVNTFNSLVASVTDEVNTLATEAMTEMLETVNTAISELVSDNGTDSVMYECANAQLNATEELIAETISSITGCVESSVLEVTSVITELADLIDESLTLVTDIGTAIQTCEALSTTLAQELCLSTVLVSCTTSSATIIAEGTALMTTITTLQTSLLASLELCGSTSLASAALSETEILAKIALCSVTSVV